MFLERAYCIASPTGHGLSSDCLYDITREPVLHGADLEAKCRIMQTPKAAASCEWKKSWRSLRPEVLERIVPDAKLRALTVTNIFTQIFPANQFQSFMELMEFQRRERSLRCFGCIRHRQKGYGRLQ